MFIAMNRFKVVPNAGEDFERVWTTRDSYLDAVPGFIAFHLLRGPEHEDHVLYSSARTKLSDEVAEEIRKHFGSKVCRSIVPRTVRLSEAPSFGQPIILFDSSSRGALAYRELAKEVSGGASQRVG